MTGEWGDGCSLIGGWVLRGAYAWRVLLPAGTSAGRISWREIAAPHDNPGCRRPERPHWPRCCSLGSGMATSAGEACDRLVTADDGELLAALDRIKQVDKLGGCVCCAHISHPTQII